MRTFGKIKLDDGFWCVSGEPHVVLRMKRLFAKASACTPGEIHLTNTPENCRDLLWFLDRYPMEIHHKHKTALEAGAISFDENILTMEKILAGKYSAKKLDLAVPARDYQKIAAQLYLQNKFLLLADDVGLGKTASFICSLMDPNTRPAVVCTLTHLPKQWQAELRKFAPSLTSHIIKSGKPYELPVMNGQKPDVLIINYHKLNGWAKTLSEHAKSIAFDEIQELRRTESAKYTAALSIARAMKYRCGLSATPIFNYGGEFWNVINVLSEDALGNKDEFQREWCRNEERIGNPAAFGSFLREKGIMLRRTRSEVGREIPPVIQIPHYIDSDASALDSVQGSASELARLILSETQLGRGDAFNAAGKFDAMMRQATGIAKAPFVADFVRLLIESGERVVLFGWHHEVYSIWQEKLKEFNPTMYTGLETPTQKEESKRKFISGESNPLIISLRAGAGLDGLQHVSRTCVVGELDWSFSAIRQCIGRLARDGQKDPVTAYFLLAEDGADPIMSDVLGIKRQQLDGVINPTQDLIEKLQNSGDHVRKLAAAYLDKLGMKPEPVKKIIAGVEYEEEDL